jgi:predicted TIM-barrel fold metal-dependent hydrolase
VNAGWKEPPPSKPPTYEDALPSSFKAKDRVKLMNEYGVFAQVLYPNVAGFGAQQFAKIQDDDLKTQLVRAYNDYQVEFAAQDNPERFVLNTALPIWDVKECVKEVERCNGMGHRAILFVSRPNSHGLPWLADRYWDPLWDVASQLDLPINFHIGTGDVGDVFKAWPGASKRTVYSMAVSLIFLSNCQALIELVFSGVLQRYPKLKFVSVESGIGWVPFIMEGMDHEFFDTRVWEERPDFEMLPSEYFKKHVYTCYWFEKYAPNRMLDVIGYDRVLFETDFPHPTSLYPAASVKAHVARGLADQTPEVRRRVLSLNAAELYRVNLPADQEWRKG